MNYRLRNKKTGEIIDPRSSEFALSPADFECKTWDEVFAQDRETDLVDGYETILVDE